MDYTNNRGTGMLTRALALLAVAIGGCAEVEPPPYTVSGVITVQQNTFVDLDVNDSYAPRQYHRDNNSYTTAQQIQNPARVGGYANIANSGYGGSSYSSGDTDDYFKVTLPAGETINLYTIDPAPDNLDLFLYDVVDPLTPIAASESVANVDTLTVPAIGSGVYFVRVKAIVGGSNYLLTVGNVGATGLNEQTLVYDNFVPGELLIQFKNGQASDSQAALSAATGLPLQGKIRQMAKATFADPQLRQQLLQRMQVPAQQYKQRGLQVGSTMDAEKQLKLDTLLIRQALLQRDDIASVDVNYLRQATAIPADPYYSRMWNLPLIRLPDVWTNTGYTGSGSTVAVIDTGVVMSHPDLAGQLTSDGYDFISNAFNAGDGDGIDANPDDPGDGLFYPSTFHGTHVSGTIAAANNSIGVVGVAYGAKVMPLRVLGKLGGTDYDIIQAIYYAAGLPNDSLTIPSRRADIINMSLGGPGSSTAFQNATTAAYNAGVIIVAAAGNNATDTKNYPAAYPDVIAVSAVDQTKELAFYSSYGQSSDNWIDIAAPGGDTRVDLDTDGHPDGILSTLASDSTGSIVPGYDYYQGTSMAAPHVSGVIALMLEANKSNPSITMTPALLKGWLANISDDLGDPGKDIYYGNGLINAAKAVAIADGSTTFPAGIALGTNNVYFTPALTGMRISVYNSGTDGFSDPITVAVNQQNGETWLQVATDSVDTNNLGGYLLSVDRSGLADGNYDASITFSSLTAGVSDTTLNVHMTVGFTGNEDAGYHYIILYDATSGLTVGYDEAAPTNGVYYYSFTGIPEGSYYLIAGSDMDNDGVICNAGEACGHYSVAPIHINHSVNNMNFVSGFEIPITGMQSGLSPLPPQGFRRPQ